MDEDVCTGDHACIRLSGCPSLSLKRLDDPLRDDPVASIDQSCVGCGNCGEVADAAILCPSFYRADVVHNPGAIGALVGRGAGPGDRLAAGAATGADGCSLRTRHDAAGRPSDRQATRCDVGQIIKLAVLAVGGQGGGVLTGWIEDLARAGGYAAQATSVAGVAQRTGATIYYVEMAPQAPATRRSFR